VVDRAAPLPVDLRTAARWLHVRRLSAGEIDASRARRTLAAFDLRARRELLAELEPDLIVTQELCPVCPLPMTRWRRSPRSADQPRVIHHPRRWRDARDCAYAPAPDPRASTWWPARARIDRPARRARRATRPRRPVVLDRYIAALDAADDRARRREDPPGARRALRGRPVGAASAARPAVVVVMPSDMTLVPPTEALATARSRGVGAARVVARRRSAYFSRPTSPDHP